MQKSPPAKTSPKKGAEKDDGSDSEPSCDNFDQTELEENLRAALDDDEEINEGCHSPFMRPFGHVEEETSQETSQSES